jgi:hypothetical protein
MIDDPSPEEIKEFCTQGKLNKVEAELAALVGLVRQVDGAARAISAETQLRYWTNPELVTPFIKFQKALEPIREFLQKIGK